MVQENSCQQQAAKLIRFLHGIAWNFSYTMFHQGSDLKMNTQPLFSYK